MRLKILLVITALLALAAIMAINANTNPQDVANGWYPNLPKVTTEMLAKRVTCLVNAGAPANPSITSASLLPEGFAPAELTWTRNGKSVSTTAVLTYYGPDVAYVEIAQALGLPLKRIACPDTEVLVSMPSPIGAPWPEKCATCFHPSAADKFEYGATWRDGTGTYEKQRKGFPSFFGVLYEYALWNRVRDY